MFKSRKKLLSGLMIALILMLPTGVFAADYAGDEVYPGLSNIKQEDRLTLPRNTIWATLTARWGVYVIFKDWDETILKSELIPVTDTEPGKTTAPETPMRDGWSFVHWERVSVDEKSDENVKLDENGEVTDITGPGPIVYRAAYEKSKLTIKKTLKNYELQEGWEAEAGEQTFVFSVDARYDRDGDGKKEVVFSNAYSMRFTHAGTKELVIEGLMIGADITVTELNSGAAYDAAKASKTITLSRTGSEVEFINQYGHHDRREHGASNEYTKIGSDWTVKHVDE